MSTAGAKAARSGRSTIGEWGFSVSSSVTVDQTVGDQSGEKRVGDESEKARTVAARWPTRNGASKRVTASKPILVAGVTGSAGGYAMLMSTEVITLATRMGTGRRSRV